MRHELRVARHMSGPVLGIGADAIDGLQVARDELAETACLGQMCSMGAAVAAAALLSCLVSSKIGPRAAAIVRQ